MRNQKLICIACALILCLCIFTACGDEVDADLHITITFMVDGEVYHEMEVKNDSRIKFPDKPTKEGYVFDGWYLTEDYKEVFSTIYLTQNEVTTDLVVYAKWAIETPSGGQHGSTDVDDDAKITGILGGEVEGLIVNLDVSSTIADVDLSGMITVSEGSSWQLYADKTGQTNIPTKIAADLVDGENIFYIVVNSGDNKINRTYTIKIWKNFNVIVRFYAFGYEIHSVNKETHTWITDEDFPDVNYTGYKFLGWAEHEAGEEHYIDDEMLNANEGIIKFNAVLEGLKHTISFDGNGVDCDLDDVEVTYGSSFVLPTLTREGYTFAGWEYDGKKIASANGNKYQGYSYAENITVKARWNINSYQLTVNNDDSKGGTITSSGTRQYQYNSSVTITATPSTGVEFAGWYDGKGQKVSDSHNYTFTMPASNVTYTAKWIYYTLSTNENYTGAGTYTQKVNEIVGVGEEVALTATTNPGYTWLGWYDGDTKMSDDTTYTFTMSAENKTYTAKWEVRAEMQNFYFYTTSTACAITGIKDKTVTSIVVPDYVTEIRAGVFSGCSSLESITIPFVGAKAGVTSSDTYRYPFGYIFGASSYTGGTAVEQYYYGSTEYATYTTYYIPASLRSVTVTGGNILSGAFYKCSMLTSIDIPDSVTIIAGEVFYECRRLASIDIPEGVTRISMYAFYGCSSLGSITIPDSVRSIDGYAFEYCGLSSVVFKNPYGWSVGTPFYERRELGGLTNSSTNATYLVSTYLEYDWIRRDIL